MKSQYVCSVQNDEIYNCNFIYELIKNKPTHSTMERKRCHSLFMKTVLNGQFFLKIRLFSRCLMLWWDFLGMKACICLLLAIGTILNVSWDMCFFSSSSFTWKKKQQQQTTLKIYGSKWWKLLSHKSTTSSIDLLNMGQHAKASIPFGQQYSYRCSSILAIDFLGSRCMAVSVLRERRRESDIQCDWNFRFRLSNSTAHACMHLVYV